MNLLAMSELDKASTDSFFAKEKSIPENQVILKKVISTSLASIVVLRTHRGPQSPLESTYALTVLLFIEILECTLVLFGKELT